MNEMGNPRPTIETFLGFDFEPMNLPVTKEFGDKVADIIALLDNKYKMKLLS